MLDVGVGLQHRRPECVKMLKAIQLNRELTAERWVIHLSKTIGVSNGSMRDEEGTLFAHATATCAIIRK